MDFILSGVRQVFHCIFSMATSSKRYPEPARLATAIADRVGAWEDASF